MSKIKSYYWSAIEASDDLGFDQSEPFDEYNYDEKSSVVRNTGLDSYTINKHYDEQESE